MALFKIGGRNFFGGVVMVFFFVILPATALNVLRRGDRRIESARLMNEVSKEHIKPETTNKDAADWDDWFEREFGVPLATALGEFKGLTGGGPGVRVKEASK